MSKSIVAIAALLLAACSDADPVLASEYCDMRGGSYRVHWLQRSGDCGSVPDEVVEFGKAPASCVGSFAPSERNCVTSGAITCTASGGEKMRTSGRCEWSNDASTGTCEIAARGTEADGSAGCSGSYKVTYQRQ
jgi:hypothetical protein